jgi:hypothetical protein
MRELQYYYLEGKEIKSTKDITEWAIHLDYDNKIVEQTTIQGVFISTVFLGIDHGWGSDVPILFETMVFGGKYNEYQWRYATWDEAYKGHHEVCAMVSEEGTRKKFRLPRKEKKRFKKYIISEGTFPSSFPLEHHYLNYKSRW